jgi:Fe-S cluster assembly protein SufD
MSAVVDFPVKPEARPYIDAFAGVVGSEPEWLAARRRRDLTRFAEQGFPSRRSEAWRYIDLRALQERPKLPDGRLAATREPIRAGLGRAELGGGTHLVVLVNGRFDPALSRLDMPGASSPGVWLGSMARAIEERPEFARSEIDSKSPFAALNGAFFSDGFVLAVDAGTRVDRPIEVVHLGVGDGSLHTRSVISMGPGSRASIIETYAGDGSYWRNDLVALQLAEAAELERVLLVEEAAAAMHFDEMVGELAAHSRLANFALVLDGHTVRHEASIRMTGNGAHCRLDGAFVVGGRQEANIVTSVDHAAPGGETREVFKGVAAGRAHGAFQGRITVRPGAQKVDAHQLSRNLVLGPRAAIDTKPELEIFADDVKCSHGAAIGDLDEAALFYLATRGIGREEARRILIEAFVGEAVELIGSPLLREHLSSRLARRLAMLEE